MADGGRGVPVIGRSPRSLCLAKIQEGAKRPVRNRKSVYINEKL